MPPAFAPWQSYNAKPIDCNIIAGVDMDADFDVWIDRFCLDADLFVWVVNGESTLMRREKAFFEQVAAKLAKPNILVVVNRLVHFQRLVRFSHTRKASP